MLPSDGTALLEVEGLAKQLRSLRVLDRVDLRLAEGGVTAVIGASGSGKSTLLRCINALEEYQAGMIRLARPAPLLSRRGRAQGGAGCRIADCRLSGPTSAWCSRAYNLFPHMTARQNVLLGLRPRAPDAGGAGATRSRWTGWRASGSPSRGRCTTLTSLSGGQQQRVATRPGVRPAAAARAAATR